MYEYHFAGKVVKNCHDKIIRDLSTGCYALGAPQIKKKVQSVFDAKVGPLEPIPKTVC